MIEVLQIIFYLLLIILILLCIRMVLCGQKVMDKQLEKIDKYKE
ncbi:hypothetical protein UMN179_00364 [Gallibacterium anatis UMN179]|uniref:Uncharacterized protein n=1 Tax=Gallibacterium anatis (strain UMN179) TaxID=1005058 RepID=F4HBX4_GALAU|nr:hypothetical protein UMN179_00364 [Gallibacterium anatis UMN179]